MLDSLVRKFSKLNKNQTNTHQNPPTKSNHLAFCSSSSFTSSISSSSSSYSSSSSTPNTPFDLNRNCVMLELYDLHDSNIKPDTYHINNTIPEQVEHIYEEIEENNNHIMSHHNHKTSNKIVMLREELINEILPSNTSSLFSNKSSSSSGSSSTSSSFSSKKKKSVRFNSTTSGQEVLNGKLAQAKESSQITSNVIHNDLILCSECVNCLKHQPIIHHNQHSFNSILKKPLNDESTSSSSSFYTTNSINSTSSIITSTHSHTFNQLIEDFLNQATKSPSKCNKISNNTLPSAFKQCNHFQNEPSVTLGLDQSKKGSSSSCKSFVYFKNNSENNGTKNVSQTKSAFDLNKLFNTPTLSSISHDSSNVSTSIDDRLSFRVTNLTMQDLKNRQKLIELKKSCSMNIFF